MQAEVKKAKFFFKNINRLLLNNIGILFDAMFLLNNVNICVGYFLCVAYLKTVCLRTLILKFVGCYSQP